ncbi:MAG TPA: hypothetical protein VNB22_01380 [Pyrinomonadaceae bacterium]|jgi:hypothetical protein|nr:hypothetical protein [Pyrinomonadaceae bacterium]
MEKTYSQKVARVFEIVDYFLLLPAGVGALVGFFALFGQPLYGLLIYMILGVGMALLVGYFKHSRGRLDEKYISVLWLTTAVYNFLLFLPWLYNASTYLQPSQSWARGENQFTAGFFLLLAIVLGYIFAIVFSIRAYSFEKRKAFYQRNQLLKTFDKIEIS